MARTKMLRIPEVKDRTGLARSTIYLRMSEGRFPKCIKLGEGARAVGWIENEIEDYLDTLIDASRSKLGGPAHV